MTNCKRVTVWLELLGRSLHLHIRVVRLATAAGGLQGTEYAQNHQSPVAADFQPIDSIYHAPHEANSSRPRTAKYAPE